MPRIATALLLLSLASSNVLARQIFLSDFSSNATVETFESLSRGFQPDPMTLNGLNYMGPGFLAVDNGFPMFANIQPPNSSSLTLYSSGSTTLPFIIQFTTPVDRIGLLLSSGGTLSWILTALDASSNVLENAFVVQPGSSQAVFGGFENFSGIGELIVQVANPNPSGLFPHFDDVRYERLAIPEPATALLFGAAALTFGFFILRRAVERVASRPSRARSVS